MRYLSAAAVILSGLAFSNAQAAETIWLDSDHTPYSGYYASGTSLAFSSGAVNARVSGWSIHGDGQVYQARLGVWNQGIGVLNGSGDNSHTIDNSGYLDFIVLQFDQAISIEEARFNTGWHGMTDTDATIGYAMSAAAYGSALGLTGLQKAALPFDLFASGSVGNSGSSYRNVNPANYIGNTWLIGASFNNPEGSRKLDGFKLEKLQFSVAAVPEPSTWAMMLLGFAAVGFAMRRRNQKLTDSYA